MDLTALIETRAGMRSGEPCFVGARIAVYDVLADLASEMTVEETVADFPELIRAAPELAALSASVTSRPPEAVQPRSWL